MSRASTGEERRRKRERRADLETSFPSLSSLQEEDFEEDEGIYDDLDLQEDEDHFGLGEKDDILSSHDSQSLADGEFLPSSLPSSLIDLQPLFFISLFVSAEVSEPIRTPAKSRITVNTNHDEESSNGSGALARKTSLDDASTSPTTKKTPVRSEPDHSPKHS